MKNKSTTRTAKKKTIAKTGGIDAPLMKGDLLLLPLGLLAALSIPVVIAQFANIFQNPQPILLFLLAIVSFGLLYAYVTFRRYSRSLLTRIMAGIPAVMLLLAFLLTLFSTSGSDNCTGFFGTQTDCVSMQQLALYFLLFNPLVGLILGVTSLVGIISILLGRDRR